MNQPLMNRARRRDERQLSTAQRSRGEQYKSGDKTRSSARNDTKELGLRTTSKRLCEARSERKVLASAIRVHRDVALNAAEKVLADAMKGEQGRVDLLRDDLSGAELGTQVASMRAMQLEVDRLTAELVALQAVAHVTEPLALDATKAAGNGCKPHPPNNTGPLRPHMSTSSLAMKPAPTDDSAGHSVIATIRREKMADVDLTSHPEIAPSVQLLRGTLHRSLTVLSKDIFAQGSHFISELIQNADDNTYTCESPCWSVTRASARELITWHNEIGMCEANVRALCDAGSSTKTSESSIGRKGIGFKACFKVSRSPHILSGPFQFKFDLDAEGELGYIIPISLSEDEVTAISAVANSSTKRGTSVYLPLQQGVVLGDGVSFAQLDPHVLLFLRQLRRLECHDELTDSSLIHSIKGPGQVKANDRLHEVQIKTLIRGPDESQTTTKRFIRAAYQLSVPQNVFQQDELRPSQTQVVLCFPVDVAEAEHGGQEDDKAAANCFLYAHLPIKRVGLPFLVNGDFDLTACRRDLHRNAWNSWLRDRVADCFLAAIKAAPELAGRAECYLPSGLKLFDTDWQPVVERIVQGLKQEDICCFRAEDGSMCAPSRILVRPEGSEAILSTAELLGATGFKFARETPRLDANTLVRRFGVQRMQLQHTLQWVANGIDLKTSSEWFAKLYRFIYLQLQHEVKQITEELQTTELLKLVHSMRIFPVTADADDEASEPSNCSLMSLDDTEIYTGLAAGCPKLHLCEQGLFGWFLHPQVHLACQHVSCAAKLLAVVDIKEATAPIIVDHILDTHAEAYGNCATGEHLESSAAKSLWHQLAWARDQMHPYLQDESRRRSTHLELLVVAPAASNAPHTVTTESALSHCLMHTASHAVSADQVISLPTLSTHGIDNDPAVAQILWQAFFVQIVGVRMPDPNTSAVLNRSNQYNSSSLDAIAMAAAVSPQALDYIMEAAYAWRKETLSASITLDGRAVVANSSYLFLRDTCGHLLDNVRYLSLPKGLSSDSQDRAAAALSALGVNVKLCSSTILKAIQIQLESNNNEQTQRSPQQGESFDLAYQTKLLEWLQAHMNDTTEGTDSSSICGWRLELEQQPVFFDGRQVAQQQHTPPDAFVSMESQTVKWLPPEDSMLGQVLGVVDLSRVYPSCRHLFLSISTHNHFTQLTPSEVHLALSLLSDAFTGITKLNLSPAQDTSLSQAVASSGLLHMTCLRAYSILAASVLSEDILTMLHRDQLILVPSGVKTTFRAARHVAWADGSTIGDDESVDAIIMRLSHTDNLSTIFPTLREFFVDKVEVGVVGTTWLLPIPECVALLLYLQRNEPLPRKLYKAVCRRMMQMVAMQPPPKEGTQARDEYMHTIEELRGSAGPCPHGFEPADGATECREPACKALTHLQEVAAQMSTGRNTGASKENRFSKHAPRQKPDKKATPLAAANSNNNHVEDCLNSSKLYEKDRLRSQHRPECKEQDHSPECSAPQKDLRKLKPSQLDGPVSLPVYINTKMDVGKLPPIDQVNEFACLLTSIGNTIQHGLPQSFHLFYAPEPQGTTTIAFNQDGALFFSLDYHVSQVLPNESDPISFWYVTMCHELAHNRERGHNRAHEKMMQTLIIKYMPQIQSLTRNHKTANIQSESSCPGHDYTKPPEPKHQVTHRKLAEPSTERSNASQRRKQASAYSQIQASAAATVHSGIHRRGCRGLECTCGFSAGTKAALELHIMRSGSGHKVL